MLLEWLHMFRIEQVRNEYRALHSVSRILFVVLLFLVVAVGSLLPGFAVTVAFADAVLASIQWIFDWDPVDADPAFALAWVVTHVLFSVAVTFLVLRVLGARLPAIAYWGAFSFALLTIVIGLVTGFFL